MTKEELHKAIINLINTSTGGLSPHEILGVLSVVEFSVLSMVVEVDEL